MAKDTHDAGRREIRSRGLTLLVPFVPGGPTGGDNGAYLFNGELKMIKGKEYHTHTESYAREKESWFAEVPVHIEQFLLAGGRVYQAAVGESAYNPNKPHAFRINAQKECKLKEKKK